MVWPGFKCRQSDSRAQVFQPGLPLVPHHVQIVPDPGALTATACLALSHSEFLILRVAVTQTRLAMQHQGIPHQWPLTDSSLLITDQVPRNTRACWVPAQRLSLGIFPRIPALKVGEDPVSSTNRRMSEALKENIQQQGWASARPVVAKSHGFSLYPPLVPGLDSSFRQSGGSSCSPCCPPLSCGLAHYICRGSRHHFI